MISKEQIKEQIKRTEIDIKYIKAYDKNLSEYGKQLLQEKLFTLEKLPVQPIILIISFKGKGPFFS